MIDVGIPPEKRCPLGIDYPGNVRLRVGFANRRDGRQSMHHVTKRTWFDDQDGFDFSVQGERKSRHAAVAKRISSPEFEAIGQQARQTCLNDFLLRSREVVF